VAPQAGGHLMLSALTPEPSPVRARGAGHEAFMHLFARPFDLAAATSFELENLDAAQVRWEKDVQDAKDRQTFRRKLSLGAFGLSVATAAAGAGYLWSGHNLITQANGLGSSSANYDDAKAARDTGNRRYLIGDVLLGVAGASAITGALLYFWPSAPNVSVSSTPDCGACLAYQRTF
jgi:hypothetical protein